MQLSLSTSQGSLLEAQIRLLDFFGETIWVDILVRNFWWKTFSEKLLLENFGREIFCGNFGRNVMWINLQ